MIHNNKLINTNTSNEIMADAVLSATSKQNDATANTQHDTADSVDKTNSEKVSQTNERTNVSPSQTGEEDESGKKIIEGQSSISEEDGVGPDDLEETDDVVEDVESHLLPATDEAIDNLTQGFLQAFVPHLETSYNSLDELMRNQRVLIETVQQENVKCSENHLVTELAETMTEARIYHSKLVNIKKEMTTLHERTTKLKKRALKLQQQKMKENLAKEQQREKELDKERHLIAKPAARKTEPAS